MEQRPEARKDKDAQARVRIDPEEEASLFEVLSQLGVDDKPARVVAYLAAKGEGKSSEIERACDMRQPEVSQATMALRDWGWVVAAKEKRPGKGRPVNNYLLDVSLLDIANEIEAEKREEINQELARIQRLKNLVGDPETADVETAASP